MSRQDFEEAVDWISDPRALADFAGPKDEGVVANAAAALGATFPPTHRDFLVRLVITIVKASVEGEEYRAGLICLFVTATRTGAASPRNRSLAEISRTGARSQADPLAKLLPELAGTRGSQRARVPRSLRVLRPAPSPPYERAEAVARCVRAVPAPDQ